MSDPANGTGRRARGRWGPRLFWGVLLLSTLLLRLLGLADLGVWQDEGLTLYQIRLPVEQILANRIPVAEFMTRNTVPPLYFLLLGGWGRLVGFALWPLRLFGVFVSLLVVVLLYRVGEWMGDRRTGWLAALLGAISPLYLWYAQELRMYMLLLCFATLSFGLLWKWYEGQRRRRRVWPLAVAYGVTVALMAWTHYLAFFLIGAQVVWLFLVLLRHRPRLLLGTAGGMLLLVAPLVPFGARRFLSGAERDFYFQPLDFIVNNLLHSFGFGIPIFMSDPAQVVALFPLLWGLLAVGLWEAWRRGRWPLALLLGGGLLLPVLALFAASFVKPLYQNARHLLFISPAFYLLWALGMQRLASLRRWLPLLLLPFLAYGWIPAVSSYFDGEAPEKVDVRPLFEELAERYVPGDVVALNDPVLQHAFNYFAPGVPWRILPPYGSTVTEEQRLVAYEQVSNDFERVWYVYGPPDSTFDTADQVLYWFQDNYPRLHYLQYPGTVDVGAILFDTQGPVVQAEPFPVVVGDEESFEDGIRFRGLVKPLAPVPAGQEMVVETAWAAVQQPAQDYQLQLRLRDGSGRIWYQAQREPLGGLHRTSHWLAGQQVRLPIFLHPPADLPPATYQLELALVGPDGRVHFPQGSNAPLPLGALPVTRAVSAAGVEGPQIGDALRVQVAPLPTSLPPAATLPLALRVEVLRPDALPERWELKVESLGAAEGAPAAWQISLPLAAGLPTDEAGAPQLPPGGWQVGDTLTLRYPLALPPALEGRFRLRLGAWADDEASSPLSVRRWWRLVAEAALPLGTVDLEARSPRREAPTVAQARESTWPDHIRLLGYNVVPEGVVRAGEPLHLQLLWQALAPTDRPYKVFLHLLDPSGAMVAGADAFWDVPSVAWQEGEYLVSEHLFAAVTLQPGRYSVVVGAYHEESGERLPVDAPNLAFPLGEIEVVE